MVHVLYSGFRFWANECRILGNKYSMIISVYRAQTSSIDALIMNFELGCCELLRVQSRPPIRSLNVLGGDSAQMTKVCAQYGMKKMKICMEKSTHFSHFIPVENSWVAFHLVCIFLSKYVRKHIENKGFRKA